MVQATRAHVMNDPITAAERAEYYLARAEEAEAQIAKCPNTAMAEHFRAIARQWRDLLHGVIAS